MDLSESIPRENLPTLSLNETAQVEIENRKSRTSQGRAEGGLLGRRTFHPRFVTARIQVLTDSEVEVPMSV